MRRTCVRARGNVRHGQRRERTPAHEGAERGSLEAQGSGRRGRRPAVLDLDLDRDVLAVEVVEANPRAPAPGAGLSPAPVLQSTRYPGERLLALASTQCILEILVWEQGGACSVNRQENAMAVDFLHRLLLYGETADVRAFRDVIYRAYPRTIAGETSGTEIAPFSFAGLFQAGACCRQELSGRSRTTRLIYRPWPVRTVEDGRAENPLPDPPTHNLEINNFLRPLARALPRLTFTLSTLCVDEPRCAGYLSRRREQRWRLPDRRQDFHWERAWKKSKLGDEHYDNEEAERWVEQEMLTEAFGRLGQS